MKTTTRLFRCNFMRWQIALAISVLAIYYGILETTNSQRNNNIHILVPSKLFIL